MIAWIIIAIVWALVFAVVIKRLADFTIEKLNEAEDREIEALEEEEEEDIITDPIFTCVVCGIKHISPGKDPKNGVWLFPKDTASTSYRNNYGINSGWFIHCIGCREQK